ncbi:MAG TPA: hypothetical protein VKA05_08980 [Acidimicrobiales bacterium]|nr:hypothetical protein [Acidimicrobiales bacterium]
MSAVTGSAQLAQRSAADVAMRRLLRVPDTRPGPRADAAAQRMFSASILISATRCLLGYVVFPVLAPALGAAAGWTPIVGIPLGFVALFFDVKGIRRFFVADHRWRWPIAALYLAVMVLVVILLVRDFAHIF